MENVKQRTKDRKGNFPRVCISILHEMAIDKCSANAYTYSTGSLYQAWYVLFPTPPPCKKLFGPPGGHETTYSFGAARLAPLNR